MTDTIFGKIAKGTIPCDKVYEDDRVLAFRDITPQAPVHILIIPREGIATADDLTDSHEALVGHMVVVAARIARQEKISESGYRLVMNCREDGGQTVFHLHLHLLGGRAMDWPPG
jgi:histidine triad (HIT) family protein